MKKVETLSIRETVFKQLRAMILNNELNPGDKLSEAELAEQLGVSRTPVREALHKLELEDLIVIKPRKYCLVKGITSESINEINLIRSQLEPVAARCSVDYLTDEDLKYIGELLDEAINHFESNDVDSLSKAHDEFHSLIIKASNLKRTIKILENLHDYIYSFRYSFMARPDLVQRSIYEHHDIYEALKERDKDKVERLFRNHLEGVLEYENVVLEDMKATRFSSKNRKELS
ncbi:GntR family transcriptional regulator [Salipaludibacillus sp. CUR1]|uniref:GntR family transcriptional regulator n=1 Tax=Salipaludibacillus sp. CUR1 TaxID=2820003 RepID=UPI001E648845|nr:GntR family transcriptional regulator [Salipaludibacillus sp. CUR1]MCE7792910.1 GntR family transcriptional regulator [Salipaludibacillus sp. CUR1]